MTAAYLFGVLALVRLAAQAPARGIVGALAMLPPLLLAVWAGVNIRISQVIAAVVVLQADPGVSLKALFAPAALVILPGPSGPMKLPAAALLPLPYRR